MSSRKLRQSGWNVVQVGLSSNFEFSSTSIPAGVNDALSFAFVIKLLAITLMSLRFLEPTTVSGELS